MGEKPDGFCAQPTEVPDDDEAVEIAPVDDQPPLSRDAILCAVDVQIVEVVCPEWGGIVHVRTISGTERDAIEQLFQDRRRGDSVQVAGMKAEIVVRCACDAEGVPLFTRKDVAALNAKASRPINRIFLAAQELNGLTDDDVDDIAGN